MRCMKIHIHYCIIYQNISSAVISIIVFQRAQVILYCRNIYTIIA